jgi:hypothetical protein
MFIIQINSLNRVYLLNGFTELRPQFAGGTAYLDGRAKGGCARDRG